MEGLDDVSLLDVAEALNPDSAFESGLHLAHVFLEAAQARHSGHAHNLGAVASQPREAVEAGALLVGERLTPALIAEVAGVAARPSKPLDNTDLTHPYRKKMTKVFVARALRRLAGLPDSPRNEEEV